MSETVRVRFSETRTKLLAALVKASAQIEDAAKDRKNDHFKSSYADLASVRAVCREPLLANGLVVTQHPSAIGAQATVTTILGHESGEWMESELTLTARDAGPQSVGSALTYGRRYALMAVLNIAADDDDGNAATGKAPTRPPPQQAAPKSTAASQPAAVAAVRETFPGAIVTHPIPESDAARIKAEELDAATLDEDAALLRSAVEDLAGAGDEHREARRLVYLEFGCSSRANAKDPLDKYKTMTHADRQSIVRMIDRKIDMKRTGMKLPEWAGPERQPGQEG